MCTIIKSIDDYIQKVFLLQDDIDKKNKSVYSMHHKALAFRGHKNKNFELLPAIGRERAVACDISILDQERNLIEMSKYRLPNIFRGTSPLDMLALLQHYGIPTRLLDVTSNPLVSLYFAVLSENEDGEVIVFEYEDDKVATYPVINAIADSCRFAIDTVCPLKLFYKNVITQPYFDEQRSRLPWENDMEGGVWIKQCCDEILFVRAQEQLQRQKLQQGFYILFPNEICERKGEYYFNKIIKPISKTHTQIKDRIIIDKEYKKQILEQLRVLGISEATLFTDNIDIVCKNIVNDCLKYNV